MKTFMTIYEAPFGKLLLKGDHSSLHSVELIQKEMIHSTNENIFLKKVKKQLDEYFSGERKSFDIELKTIGTDFQKKTWAQLRTIPYGQTMSYKSLAQSVKTSKHARAVGSANGMNPHPIIIPCHRVCSSSGGLGGYAWGVEVKRFLLKLEKENA